MINISIEYDETLQGITGTTHNPVQLSDNATFAWLLECLLLEYPEIEQRYPPGRLYFHISGIAPKTYTLMRDGDEVFLGVV